VTALTLGLALTAAGCGSGQPPALGAPAPSSVPTVPTDPGAQLAGLAAAGLDRHFTAGYTWVTHGRAARTVVVSIATDGTWSVNVPGGALSGGADVSIIGGPKIATYQCVLGGAATSLAVAHTAPTPSGSPGTSANPAPTVAPFTAPVCMKLAASGATIPAAYDPIVEHPFTDWLSVLSDLNAPISVSRAGPLAGSTGSCFSVEPNSASIAPVVDAGIYCFRPDGTLTGAQITEGTVTLDGTVAPGPPTEGLPAPVSTGSPAPTRATH
jgi:hypothetical protein